MKVIPKSDPSSQLVVLITGMSQAGSTLCFNIVRALMSYSGAKILIPDPPHTYLLRREETASPLEGANLRGAPEAVLIGKQHDLPPTSPRHISNAPYTSDPGDPPVKIIRVRRDVRDAVASRLRKEEVHNRDRDILKEYFDLNILWHESWAHTQDCDWAYEDYKEDPLAVTRELQGVLGLSHSDGVIAQVVYESENLKNFYDDKKECPGTLDGLKHMVPQDFENVTKMKEEQVTNNGVIGSYKDFFSEEEIVFINTMYGDWLKEHGYIK